MPPANSRRDDDSKKDESPKSRLHNFVSTVLIFVAAPLVALFLVVFGFQNYEVEGPSMENTLQNGDRLIVLKVPRTWSRITNNPYVPKRGEVIVFNRPDTIAEGGKRHQKQLIKRVVGLPGEHVFIKDGVVTIFSETSPEGFQPDNLPGFKNIIHTTTGNTVDQKVPENEVFVLGDNRANSEDSRKFGTIPVEDIVGQLSLRIYPLNKIKNF